MLGHISSRQKLFAIQFVSSEEYMASLCEILRSNGTGMIDNMIPMKNCHREIIKSDKFWTASAGEENKQFAVDGSEKISDPLH